MNASRQRGATMVELLIGLPMFVLLIFIIAELAQLHEAKSILDAASLAAARAGAINHGDPGRMRDAAAVALSPLHSSDTGSGGVAAGIGKSLAQGRAPAQAGSVSVVPGADGAMNGAPGAAHSAIRVDVLSPTQQMMKDFGVSRKYGEQQSRTVWQERLGMAGAVKGASTKKAIPNDNLMYREAKLLNNVSVQDANLLKIRVTYLYETKMPLTRYFFTPLMNANLTGTLFGGQAKGSAADAAGGWRVPLVSYATVRMQSDFWEGSLSASAAGSGGGTWDGASNSEGGNAGSGAGSGSVIVDGIGEVGVGGIGNIGGGSGGGHTIVIPADPGNGTGKGDGTKPAKGGSCTCPPCSAP